MADTDDSVDGSVEPRGRFVVSHPCPACRGEGRGGGGETCGRCRGTGVARYYHGTKADLKPGDLIEAGRSANFGNPDRTTTFVYFTGTLDAATWGAELARGDSHGRIYVVEPTGAIENDPNLTDKRFPGNPTRSYRSRDPLRVVAEVIGWVGHTPEELRVMRDGLEQLQDAGVEPID